KPADHAQYRQSDQGSECFHSAQLRCKVKSTINATNSNLTACHSRRIVRYVNSDAEQRNLGDKTSASYRISAGLINFSDTTVSNQSVCKVSTYDSPTIERRCGNLVKFLCDATNDVPRGGLSLSWSEEVSTIEYRRSSELLTGTLLQNARNVRVNLVSHCDAVLSSCSALKLACSLQSINIRDAEAVVIFLIHNQHAGGYRYVIIFKINVTVVSLDLRGTNLRDIYRIARVLQHRLEASISDARCCIHQVLLKRGVKLGSPQFRNKILNRHE